MFSINSFLSKAAVAAALLFPVQAAAQCVILLICFIRTKGCLPRSEI